MLQRTFLHLPYVSRSREQRLWAAGFTSWASVREALQSGRTVHELVSGYRQRTLFPREQFAEFDPRTAAWLDCLDRSDAALQCRRYDYFLSQLRPADHWRLLDRVEENALFLDIETTGLSREIHYATVIGALFRRRFYQWVWPEPLDKLAELLEIAPLVITFNGKRFDLPFLRRHAPALPAPRAHLDLLPVVRGAGFKGGQKEVEAFLGLQRDSSIRDYGGAEAVMAWCGALYGNRKSFRELLAYNRADVEMMPRIAAEVYQLRANALHVPKPRLKKPTPASRAAHKAMPFAGLQAAWHTRRPHLSLLEGQLTARFGRQPNIVGIDLRAKEANPTGWAQCIGPETHTEVLYTDAEILERTLRAKPDLVSIDAPLFLPRGRKSVSDDSPCRATGGIVRDAERMLWARQIRVYPALIRQMQGLTRRGIELTAKLRSHGIEVIESYPGAAQDVLNIPRRKHDESLLHKGLTEFGYAIEGKPTHDELDAVTSALVGQFYLADRYEGLGASDEGFMIVPRWQTMTWQDPVELNATNRPTVFLLGLPGAGKTTLAHALADRPGWETFVLGDRLRAVATTDPALSDALAAGLLAPEAIVERLIQGLAAEEKEARLLIDGYPRHPAQLGTAERLFPNGRMVVLDVPVELAAARLAIRHNCARCGAPSQQAETYCPKCGGSSRVSRPEDRADSIRRRLSESRENLKTLLQNISAQNVVRVDASRPLDQVIDELAIHISV